MVTLTLEALSKPVQGGFFPHLTPLLPPDRLGRLERLTAAQIKDRDYDAALVEDWERELDAVDRTRKPVPFVSVRRVTLPIMDGQILDHEHTYRFYGDAVTAADVLPGAARVFARWNLDKCHHPFYVVCSDPECWAGFVTACKSSNAQECKPCEALYRRQVRTVVREVLFVARKGSASLLTLAAPGSKGRHCTKHLYYDKTDGKLRPSYRCDFSQPGHSPCPCGEEGNALHTREDMENFNTSAVARWNDFVTDLRRSVPGFSHIEYFRAVEAQERGAIHFHVVIMNKGRVVPITQQTIKEITRYATAHGFGHEVDLQQIANSKDEQAKIARYVGKYVSKALSDDRDKILLPRLWGYVPVDDDIALTDGQMYADVSMPVRAHNRPKPYRYRTWFASRGWGLSLGRVRELQTVYGTEGAEASAELLAAYLAPWTDPPDA